MCIIAIKPAGVAMPSAKTFTNMWINNPDGSGFMYADRGRVFIEKGFMKKAEFDHRLEEIGKRLDMKKTPFVFHFRITTHGGTCEANCHPFPISDNVAILQKGTWVSDIGVAHNGVIPITPRKNISDTMEYIVSQLAYIKRCNKKFYKNRNMMKLIENAVHSKLAFLADDGQVYTIGEFKTVNGMMFSNTSYEPRISYSYYDTSLPWYDYKRPAKNEVSPFTVKPLMFLSDNAVDDVIVKNTLGEIVDTSDYAVDTKGKLYILDQDSGCAYPSKHNSVYGTIKFDVDKASNITCYGSLDALLVDWYGTYGGWDYC